MEFNLNSMPFFWTPIWRLTSVFNIQRGNVNAAFSPAAAGDVELAVVILYNFGCV